MLRSLLAGGTILSLGAGIKSTASAASNACAALPAETSGPFPADGSDRRGPPGAPPPPRAAHDRELPPEAPDGFAREHPGAPDPGGPPHDAIPNVLALPGVERFDIRSSFGNSFTVAPGVSLRLDLRLLDMRSACQPLAGCAVYLWNCNRDGEYSLYGRGIAHENYLRGVQVSDGYGRVAFRTIFPGCYAGRYPHVHMEVFKQKERALDATARILTTQLTFAREICTEVYTGALGYMRSVAHLQGQRLSEDNVFASSSPSEIALQTLSIKGDLKAGLIGHADVALIV